MGLSGISPLSLLLIAFLAILFLGGNRIKNLSTDLGHAIKNFRKALNEKDDTSV